MKLFDCCQAQSLRQKGHAPFYAAGGRVTQLLLAAVIDPACTITLDYDLVAIDFGGGGGKAGITEFGLAVLNTSMILNYADDPANTAWIKTTHYARAKHHSRSFRFGNATRIDKSHLARLVRDELAGLGRPIILVGHDIHSNLTTLKNCGISLEDDLPAVVGIIDTGDVWKDLNGGHGSLGKILESFHVPWEPESLHYVGNDANYTMRAFMALLQARGIRQGLDALERGRLGAFGRVARAPLPAWLSLKEVDRDIMDGDVEEGMLGLSLADEGYWSA